MPIDWESIAKQVGDIRHGINYGSGTGSGRRALEIVIGEENIRDAVDQAVLMNPGWDTIEMFLSVIVSKVAMNRCYKLYKEAEDVEIRNGAVALLRRFADDDVIDWIGEFLSDSHDGIRWHGLIVLQSLLYGVVGDSVIEAADALIGKAESDTDPWIRERAIVVRDQLNQQIIDRNPSGPSAPGSE